MIKWFKPEQQAHLADQSALVLGNQHDVDGHLGLFALWHADQSETLHPLVTVRMRALRMKNDVLARQFLEIRSTASCLMVDADHYQYWARYI